MILKVKLNIFIIIVAISCIILSFLVFTKSKQSEHYYKSQDIYQHYKVSKLILKGENPYLPILNSNMKKNEKYPTYLAGFYYLMAPTVKIYPEFTNWISFWKVIATISYAGVGFLIFENARKNGKTAIGIALAMVWLFNRWALYLATTLSADVIAILLLLISLKIINTKQKTSLFIFGIHLAIKHLTLFLLPLYILKNTKLNFKNIIKNIAFVLLPIILISVQFLITSPIAYLQSILFSATRFADNHFKVISLSIGEIFNFYGIYERFPMIVAICFIYLLFAKKKIEFHLSVLLILLISITFNPVFFLQYESWFIAVLLFYLANAKILNSSKDVYK